MLKQEVLMSKKSKIDCEHLGELDNGSAAVAINRAINVAMRDLDDRGDEDGKERIVTIKLRVAKVPKKNILDAKVEVNVTLPALSTGTTRAAIKSRDGNTEALFEPFNAENPDQPTLDEFGEIQDAK